MGKLDQLVPGQLKIYDREHADEFVGRTPLVTDRARIFFGVRIKALLLGNYKGKRYIIKLQNKFQITIF